MNATAQLIANLQAEARAEAHAFAEDVLARTKQLAIDTQQLAGMPLPVGVIETSRVFGQQAEAAANRMIVMMKK